MKKGCFLPEYLQTSNRAPFFRGSAAVGRPGQNHNEVTSSRVCIKDIAEIGRGFAQVQLSVRSVLERGFLFERAFSFFGMARVQGGSGGK